MVLTSKDQINKIKEKCNFYENVKTGAASGRRFSENSELRETGFSVLECEVY